MNKFLLLFLSILCSQSLFAQRANNFKIELEKSEIGDNTLRIKCQFKIDYEKQDSIVLNFGGNLAEAAINELHINATNYLLDYNNKKIIFYNPGNDIQHIRMSYEYCNLFCALSMNNSLTSEIWDVIYDGSSEFFIPHQKSVAINYKINIKCNNNIEYILSCPIKGNIRVPFNIIFFDKFSYDIREFDDCVIYQINTKKSSNSRISELLKYYSLSKSFFEGLYKDPYCNSELGIEGKTVFFFHDGNSNENRYNLRLITMSQQKFRDSSYTLFPVVHEMGHRWMGEYTILANQGTYGNAFIIESIVEFTTLCFIKETFGLCTYEAQIHKKQEIVEKNRNTKYDIPIIDINEIENYPMIYNKGPLILDKLARQYGYDKVLEVISKFYSLFCYKTDINLNNFINCMENELGKTASNELINQLKMK